MARRRKRKETHPVLVGTIKLLVLPVAIPLAAVKLSKKRKKKYR